MSDKPNPGSTEAVEMGCTCPVMDNHHGRGIGDGQFWMTESCPIHGWSNDKTDDGRDDDE